MRFILAIMVLSFIVSGYSTAAHAFKAFVCGDLAGTTFYSNEIEHSNGYVSAVLEKNEQSNKATEDNCADADCYECSFVPAMDFSREVFAFPARKSISLLHPHEDRDGNFIFELRRPPKNLV